LTQVADGVTFRAADPTARVNVYLGPEAVLTQEVLDRVSQARENAVPLTIDPNSVAGAGVGITVFVPGSQRNDPPVVTPVPPLVPSTPDPSVPPVSVDPGDVVSPGSDTQAGSGGQSGASGVSPVTDGVVLPGPSIVTAVDARAARNAELTTVTDITSLRARASDGVLLLDQLRQAINNRQDQLIDITAEVSVGEMTAGEFTSSDGQISLDCELPANIELEQCRINPLNGG
jgi:hypothetical protein